MIDEESEKKQMEPTNGHRSVRLCGVRVDDLTLSEAVEDALRERGAPCWVVTPNAVILDACSRDARLGVMLGHALLSLPDGAGVIRAARRIGAPLRERIAGIDFGEALLARAAEEGLRVFLLGGGAGVAERAAERLCARYPALRICGCCWGFFEKEGETDRSVIEHVRATRPDILLVCMGFPLQETWIESHLHLLDGVRVVAGLGGSLDVWAGDLRRAPRLVSRVGLEWAWRMAREPRRLRQLPAILRCAIGWRGDLAGDRIKK